MMKNNTKTAINALKKAIANLAEHVRIGNISSNVLNELIDKTETDLRHARRMYFVAKRDPKKVKAALKKAAATREIWKKNCAKWAKEAAAEHKLLEKRKAEGYLPESICDNHGEPNPLYYVFDHTDERSGGYRIYNLRGEWRNVPGLHNVPLHV